MAFFDCGTTTPWIIDAIDDALPFTGVCYSLNTFLALQEKPQCRAVLCGGGISRQQRDFYAAEP
ncbi:Deoxyribose operon repressor [Klebsiella aerogenes]|nr:Deoxyribose operon repressor [Klebsiella aerogenes]